MIEVHHLNQSVSHRVVWCLEELQVPYQLIHYAREPKTRMSPPALKAVHPLGKSPVMRDGDLLMAESGAIVEYIIARYGKGRLAPKSDTDDFGRYLYWMHYVGTSAQAALWLRYMDNYYPGDMGPGLRAYADSQVKLHFGFVEAELAKRPYLVGNEFMGPDILYGFTVELMDVRTGLRPGYPNLYAYMKRLQERPGYKAAIEKGGVLNIPKV
jgi:glutathione S-transferase